MVMVTILVIRRSLEIFWCTINIFLYSYIIRIICCYCIYISFSTHTLINWYFFFFVLKSIYTYRWRLKIADAILVDILQLTNWIIAGNSPKCNNMIYFNAFNLKSDCSNKTYYHFLFLPL